MAKQISSVVVIGSGLALLTSSSLGCETDDPDPCVHALTQKLDESWIDKSRFAAEAYYVTTEDGTHGPFWHPRPAYEVEAAVISAISPSQQSVELSKRSMVWSVGFVEVLEDLLIVRSEAGAQDPVIAVLGVDAHVGYTCDDFEDGNSVIEETATAEEINNSRWYERPYMVVDWSSEYGLGGAGTALAYQETIGVDVGDVAGFFPVPLEPAQVDLVDTETSLSWTSMAEVVFAVDTDVATCTADFDALGCERWLVMMRYELNRVADTN